MKYVCLTLLAFLVNSAYPVYADEINFDQLFDQSSVDDEKKRFAIDSEEFEEANQINDNNFHGLKEKQKQQISNFFNSIGDSSNVKNEACNSGDTCYRVITKKSSTRYKIECTKGNHIGDVKEICGNSSGKWATGCGFSDAFAFHDNSAHDAANKACNW